MFKMIAIDLDGTLLDNDKNFDKEKFHQLAEKLLKQGVHIVIATGNQYGKSIEYFDGLTEQLSFITDNGATIHVANKLIYNKTLDKGDFQRFIELLDDDFLNKIVVSTTTGAYIMENESDEFYNTVKIHYPKLKLISDLSMIEDPVVKLTLKLQDERMDAVEPLFSILPHEWRITQSGFGFFDIIHEDTSKLVGVEQLQALWNINTDEIIAFGDSNNDLELLEHLPHSYAMSNSTDAVKKVATHIIGSNNEGAVLQKIEDLFY